MGCRARAGFPAAVKAIADFEIDWRDPALYAPLLEADRTLFAWEWLRRDPAYRTAAKAALADSAESESAAAFGLVRFETPNLKVPFARPLWRSEVSPHVLTVVGEATGEPHDLFDLRRFARLARLSKSVARESLLLCDGLHAVRLDGPTGTFTNGPVCLRYTIYGLASGEPRSLALRRFMAVCKTGRFSRVLHRTEVRARRWILILRAWDALSAGASQREIAEALLSRSAGGPRWRSRVASIRSQVQRLARSARIIAGGGYRAMLR